MPPPFSLPINELSLRSHCQPSYNPRPSIYYPKQVPPLIGPPNLTMPVTLRVPARPDENCSEMSLLRLLFLITGILAVLLAPSETLKPHPLILVSTPMFTWRFTHTDKTGWWRKFPAARVVGKNKNRDAGGICRGSFQRLLWWWEGTLQYAHWCVNRHCR